jgi:hypothetical protein
MDALAAILRQCEIVADYAEYASYPSLFFD